MIEDNLPAVVLPNVTNSMDSTVVLSNGARVSAAELMRRLGTPAHLRLMAPAGAGWSASSPLVTWLLLEDKTVVAALAFPHEQDIHGRATSAAVVLDPSRENRIPRELPATVLRELEGFLLRNGHRIASDARRQAEEAVADRKKKGAR